MIVRAVAIAGLGGALVACASAPPKTDFIGIARMLPNRTIEQKLVAQDDHGSVGEMLMVLKPTDPAYWETIRQVGGLNPGEMKGVPASPTT